ncbi:MAG: phage terminase large subunit family protein, partial [Mesorhizobium sp.]
MTFAFLFEDGVAAIEPDPPYTVSEWADANRVLTSVSASEPGPWRTSRTPYLREIMDSLSTYSAIETVALMKGVQIGASEGGFNFVGYTIHHSPGPIMYVLPTIDMAKKFSKTRIDPMILESPALAEKIKPARSRDSGNTVMQKDFDGGALFMTGANSGSGLRGSPVSRLVLDEVDAYPASADDEGDPA